MNYRSFSLIPSLNNKLLSDRFMQIDTLFSKLTGEKPIFEVAHYDLLEKSKNNYELTISVPGYTKEELNISVLDNKLTINGKNNNDKNIDDKKEWLHKGIIKNDFSLSFNLEHKINVNKAYLDKGLLILFFSYILPEEKEPEKIVINSDKSENICIKNNE